jgi:hypothetical protein
MTHSCFSRVSALCMVAQNIIEPLPNHRYISQLEPAFSTAWLASTRDRLHYYHGRLSTV